MSFVQRTVPVEDMSEEQLDTELRANGIDPNELNQKMLTQLEAKAKEYERQGEIPPAQFTEALRQFRAIGAR